VSLNGSEDKWLVIKGWPGLTSLDRAADSKSLWAASVSEEGNALLNIDLQGHARPVWRPQKVIVGWAIPSRDGRYSALHVGSTSANAWMVERPQGLRRVARSRVGEPQLASLVHSFSSKTPNVERTGSGGGYRSC